MTAPNVDPNAAPPAHSHADDPNPVHIIVWYDYI